MKASHAPLRFFLIAILVAGAIGLANINQNAQIQSQYPAPTVHVNDFANVLDVNTRERLETVLQSLKAKSKIDFYIATVENTGSEDVADFSQRLAVQWNVGARTSGSKSLLLVVSVESKTSFTRFSRMVQPDLPEGILGELAQRMKTALGVGQFGEALDGGVRHFVTAMGQKLGFSTDDTIATANTESPTSPAPASNEGPVAVNATSQTRPRFVNEPPATSEPPPVVVKTTATENEAPARPKTSARAKPSPTPRPAAKNTQATSVGSSAKKPASPEVSDEDESEEVELTLTLPLDKRAIKLKEFLDTHPNSKSRGRAIELLISTHAALGDQKLKNGDPTGVDHLLIAINQADSTVSDQLFAGVVSQVPMNLYLRNEPGAAFKAAQDLESKYENEPKRLLAIAGFYLGIERGDEAARIAERVVKLSPDSIEGHRLLARGLHLSLRLDEAANAYKRVLELDPNSRGARGSLADLTRGIGKSEEALALYNEQMKADPKDKTATTGAVISLLDLGRKDEANNMLEAALAEDPRNLPLLTGAAYWFAAHDNHEKAFELAKKAVAIEPRYTWAQIALARSFVALKRPLDAERAIRFARQYGKFPTLNYELASVLVSMGLYDEALEVLRESFVIDSGVIQTRLAGRFPASNENFLELLAPERRASIYQNTASDSALNAKVLKDLLVFSNALATAGDNQKIDETAAAASAREFASGTDNMRTFRQLYAASRLIRGGVALQTVFELAEESKNTAEAGLNIPAATIAVQADEFRELRAGAIAGGNVPEVAEAPRKVLRDILSGRSDDLMGWVLFNQTKYEPAIEHLKRAAAVLPNGTPSWRAATWHLAVALEQSGNDAAALENYILSYKAGPPDNVRRVTIEQLYRRINGSLQGLDEKLGTVVVAESASPQPSAPETTPAATPDPGPSTANPEKTPSPEPSPSETKPEPGTPEKTTPENVPSPSPEAPATPTAEPTAAPSPTPTESASPGNASVSSEEGLRANASRLRSVIKISGRALDASRVGIPNVVVVLISPSGSVLASTTDMNGNYSFTVTPSQKTYRLIPSKDGMSFTPIDRAFVGLYDDQKEIDFVGTAARP